MMRIGNYLFKQAETPEEFEQIHRLNYRTFVGEIPQHADPGTGKLIDKFHAKNAYLIVLRADRVVGMLSTHDQPPFSIADRLSDPSILHQPGLKPLEVRLLAIEPQERNSMLFFGLIWTLYNHAQTGGYTHLFISGVENRVDLYHRLGFEALGPAVPCGQSSFVPMALTIGKLPDKIARMKQLWEEHLDRASVDQGGPSHSEADREADTSSSPAEVCLLPGPVTTSAAVQQAFHEPPIYHRGPEFIRRFLKVRRALTEMTGARGVAILNGSGTLANETVAATLAAEQTSRPVRGVLLSNGEFGQRLARQAARFGLQPRLLCWAWGKPWDLDEVDAALAEEPPGSWVWGVHQESSTGVLNDLPGLVRIARARGMRVCTDCISSLGAVPLDLREVYLATGSTGKSLGSYAGAALVFADPHALERLPKNRLPSYLDLAAALASDGPCYTFPSPTLLALEAALTLYSTPAKAQARYEEYAALGAFIRQELRKLEVQPLAAEDWACPVVTTFAPPGEETSGRFVARCRTWGFAIGGQSGYLAERRLVQIATMGAMTREMCEPFFEYLRRYLADLPAAASRVLSTQY
jgi:aspartate aminotransferase-like enzyme